MTVSQMQIGNIFRASARKDMKKRKCTARLRDVVDVSDDANRNTITCRIIFLVLVHVRDHAMINKLLAATLHLVHFSYSLEFSERFMFFYSPSCDFFVPAFVSPTVVEGAA